MLQSRKDTAAAGKYSKFQNIFKEGKNVRGDAASACTETEIASTGMQFMGGRVGFTGEVPQRPQNL